MYKLKNFILLLTIIGITSCSNDGSIKQESAENSIDINTTNRADSNDALENTISIATFNEWNANWESHWNDSYIKYFYMPLSNLQNLVNTPKVKAARLYLGYSEEDGHAHLTLVGVDKTGKSMIGTNDQIYNFTLPCPATCQSADTSDPILPPTGLPEDPENTISLATFNTWNTNWETHWDDSYIKYFTMPLSNLQNLVNTNGVVGSRFYLGYSEEDGQAHLTLVGVEEGGASMVGVNANIYNFSMPCPPCS